MTDKRSFVANRKVLYPGDYVFRQGDVGHEAYLIEDGKVEIVKRHTDESETVIGTVGRGEIFGEMALVDAGPRMASARAAEQTALIVVSERMFQAKLGKADPFLRALLNIFVNHIRTLSDRVE